MNRELLNSRKGDAPTRKIILRIFHSTSSQMFVLWSARECAAIKRKWCVQQRVLLPCHRLWTIRLLYGCNFCFAVAGNATTSELPILQTLASGTLLCSTAQRLRSGCTYWGTSELRMILSEIMLPIASWLITPVAAGPHVGVKEVYYATTRAKGGWTRE